MVTLSSHRPSRRGPSLALALAFVAMFASAPGQSFLIAVFVDDMLEGTGLSRTVFSTLYALATIVSATVSLALGRAAEVPSAPRAPWRRLQAAPWPTACPREPSSSR